MLPVVVNVPLALKSGLIGLVPVQVETPEVAFRFADGRVAAVPVRAARRIGRVDREVPDEQRQRAVAQ